MPNESNLQKLERLAKEIEQTQQNVDRLDQERVQLEEQEKRRKSKG